MFKNIDLNQGFVFFLTFFFSLLHASNLFFYQLYTAEAILAFLLAVVLRLVFSVNLSVYKNLAIFIVWTFIELSFPGYYFLGYFLQDNPLPTFSFYFGTRILLIFLIGYILVRKIWISELKESLKSNRYSPKIATIWLLTLTVGSFVVSIISFKLGITQMGVVHEMLPYKLEPLLNLARSISIPIIFILSFHYFYSMKRIRILIILIYLIWIFFEIYIRGSRGFLLSGMLPFVIYGAKNLPLKKTIQYFLILLTIGFIFFPIGKVLRQSFISPNAEFTFMAKHEVWDFYTRIFNDPMLIKDFNHTFDNSFFANRYSLLQSRGGAERFYTKEIIGSPEHVAHSQGLTALSDGFIYFGQFGAYITAILMMIIAHAIDLGKIPIINTNIATQSLSIYGLLNWLIWGEGFWDFYFTRSIMTICVFPITLILCYKLLEKLSLKNMYAFSPSKLG